MKEGKKILNQGEKNQKCDETGLEQNESYSGWVCHGEASELN